jgi:signal transduction histidine kinase
MNHPTNKIQNITLEVSTKHPVLIKTTNLQPLAEDKSALSITALVHEIRNPLSTIKIATELLKDAKSGPDHQRYIQIIDRASTRIQSLLTDLLGTNSLSIEAREICSIHDILDEVVVLAEDRIGLKHIQVSRRYDAADAKISVDKKKMLIALSNIIVNAIESMPIGNGKLSLITKSFPDRLVLEIEDNGSGIKKEDLENIFIPYFSNKPDGLGLGLSTTLDILNSSSSTVVVQSQPGVGTVFILSFKKRQKA